jgi:hypothetical protein
MSRSIAVALVATASFVVVGCEQSKSANPLSPSIAGPIPGVNISAPQILEPPAGAEIVASGELVTLLIENPSTSGERPLWLQIELAGDATFQQLLHHADRVIPGEAGRTSYRIPEILSPGSTYYWRARALDGANTGPYSSAASFRVLDPVVLEPPTPLEPIGTIDTVTPVFKLRNGRISGTTTAVYRVEVGTAPDPASIVAVLTANPDASGTTSIAVGSVPYATTYYWRAYATDGVTTSGYSNTVSFRTPAAPGGPSPTPGPSPAPTPGPGTGARTPNPPPGQRLGLPGYGAGVVEEIARAYPSALRNSCQEHGGSWEFMDRVVDRLRTYDTRWGYNGKRGNANDPSMDIVDYNYGSQPDPGTTEVYIIDVIGGHCGSNPTPAWVDQTEVTRQNGTIGRWISRGRF